MRVKPLTAAEKRSRPKKQNHAIKRITPQEEAYIAANWGAMTPNEIGRVLHRHRESIRYVARRLGLLPIGRPCKARPSRSRVAGACYRQDRIDRVDAVKDEIRRLCKATGIPVDDVPLITLARTLKRHHGWRPRNIHVAADLGDDGLFRPRPASEPCEALPGSLERIEAYARRVERGEEIWCERDRRD
jgi:hypothetical protein